METRPRHRSALRAAALACIGVALAPCEARAQALPRSISTSRQFIVEAADGQLRGALCNYAEETRARVYEFLGRPRTWRYPIGIVAREPGPGWDEGAPQQKLEQLSGPAGPIIRIDLVLTAEFQAPRLRETLVTALLVEIVHNSLGAVASPEQEKIGLPAWLVEGVIGATDPLADEGESARILQEQMGRGSLMSLRDFLASDPGRIDSVSRSLYRAYAAAFVALLTELPGGRESMEEYFRALALRRGGSLSSLLATFPALGGSEETAQRWWALNIARTTGRHQWQILSLAESEVELGRLLKLEFPASGKAPALSARPEGYQDFLKHPERRRVLGAASANLALLAGRAHPLFRPIIALYRQALASLAEGSTDNVAKRLEQAAGFLAGIKGRWKEIEDHVNWVEATQVQTRSRGFENYFEASREMGAPAPSDRPDAISRYIDTVEREMR